MCQAGSRNALGILTFVVVVASGAMHAWAGPIVTVGAEVPPAKRIPVERINHAAWDALLKKYVDAKGLVDYTDWKASVADQQALDHYLAHLSAATFENQSDRNSQLAFWINAYNAVTVKGMLREYPTSSIRNHTAKLFGYNIWKDLQFRVAGKSFSLEQMEHEILRKMGEPRIHFAIVCASLGCPRLLKEAYTADKLDTQLTSNAQAFFADPKKFQYDASQRTIAVSPILQWFGEDFGVNQREQMTWIIPYLPSAVAQQLVNSGNVHVRYLDYDWDINDQARGGKAEH